MAELKTKRNKKSVAGYIDEIQDERRRRECRSILKLMHRRTGEEPAMWGSSIVGFGSYHYKYESGREGDWFLTGFSSRRQNLTLYIMSGFGGCEKLMSKLGKYTTGKSCLYIKKLEDIDLQVLEELVGKSVQRVRNGQAIC